MASTQEELKIIGDIKRDVDSNWAKFIIRVKNLKKSRDNITVDFPTDTCVIVRVNGTEIMSRKLPSAVQPTQCQHKVKYKEKGEIVIKLRKAEPGKWLERWSPRRELSATSAPALASGTAAVSELSSTCRPSPRPPNQQQQQPIVTEPDDNE
jgi:hypothetical protein